MRTSLLLALGVSLLGAGLAGAAETSAAPGPCLLSASAPGAYALRYWPDRVILSVSAKTPVTVKAALPQPAKWVAPAEGQTLPDRAWKWLAAEKCVAVDLPAGEWRLQIGWAGKFVQPAAGQTVEVLLGGKRVALLPCTFDLEKITAAGAVTGPAALVKGITLKLSAPLKPEQVRLTVGATAITNWRPKGSDLVSDQAVALSGSTPVDLTVTAYNLASCPVKAVVLEQAKVALDAPRLAEMPKAGLVIEAEAFSGEANGKVDISDKHFQTSGGKSVYNNAGDGHWLEWKFTVPEAGKYDLFVRTACQEAGSLRSVDVDGQPVPGAGLVRFPSTGGWGYSAQEWSALQLTGGQSPAPALDLTAGEHTLRLTGVSSDHLNLDYWLLVKRP